MKEEKFNPEKNPETMAFVIENDTINRRCNQCGRVVLKERFVEGYPYQCMSCDENLLEEDTTIGVAHSDFEFKELCSNTLILSLDD